MRRLIHQKFPKRMCILEKVPIENAPNEKAVDEKIPNEEVYP